MKEKGECLFCRIVSKEIPAKIAYEDNEVVAFHDIHPQAPVHLQIIPKGHIARVSELTEGNAASVSKLVLTANRLAKELGVSEEGYRLVINCNPGAGQSVYHLHLHLLGGRAMRWPPG
ncbi:MAG: histidine triad nucleotide-binding protein [Candidatus Omnitrophica bacterium]|nr:histidine triad nucleotide-binding protein [Candidatus Omnitrophota bacterium]